VVRATVLLLGAVVLLLRAAALLLGTTVLPLKAAVSTFGVLGTGLQEAMPLQEGISYGRWGYLVTVFNTVCCCLRVEILLLRGGE
jgi:hypothetical protein